jgi:serine/threonine protein kinase
LAEHTQHWSPTVATPATEVSPQITVEVDPGTAVAVAASMPRPTLERIGRYHVLKAIGEGGMGVVYSAFDEELDRRIAIKVLGADIAVEFKGRARLMREAQAMAKLSHPNVVHVYEVGQVDSRVFVAMEYIRGVTLRDWLDQGTHSWQEKLAIVIQAGEGLFAAHEQNIVHRDFKPENVMVATDGRARVLDFGLARATDEADDEDDPQAGSRTLETAFPERQGSVLSVQLTKHGSIMGTPAYMSPEQHFGQPTDASSDQFNFCVVLYEALFGVRPFAGDNRLAIAFATKQGTITPPPAATDVPAAIKDIIVRGLAVDPKTRWPSMRALLDVLRDASTPAQVRSRAPLFAIATLAVLVISLAAVLLWPKPAAPVPSEVEAIAAEARLWASRAHWVYPDADAPEQTALRAVTALRELQGELDAPGESQADELGLEFGGTLARLGDQYWDAEGGRVFARDFYAQALLFDGSLERARERSGFLASELADLRDRAAQGTFSEAELAAADELVELAVPMLDTTAAAPAPEKIASVVTSVRKRAEKRRASSSHVGASSTPVAVPVQPTIVAAAEPTQVPPPTDVTTAVVPVDPAPLEASTDGEQAADLVPRDATAAREQAKALVAEARKLKGQGKKDPALKKMFEATRVDKRYAPAWDGLRDLHFQKGAYHEAAQYGEKAVKLAPTNGQYHLRLGEAHWKLADYTAAEKAWKSALALGVAQAGDRLEALRKR